VESDPKWHAVVQASLLHARLQGRVVLCPEKPAYLEAFHSSGILSPDIILIDGVWREDCLQIALPYIKHGTSIILHDSENEPFQRALTNLPEGVKRRDFYGPCWGIKNFRGWTLLERA
jgi:hypothetical protein